MNSASSLITTIDELQSAGITPKVTKLRSTATRKRRTFLSKTNSSGKNALGTHDTAKGSYVGGGDIAIGQGRMGTLNPVNSLGRDFKGNKALIADKYAKQVLKDRREAARDRLAGL